jgi:hypothetical protein
MRQLVGFRQQGTPRTNSAASLSDPAYMAMQTELSTAENVKLSEKR